MGTAMVARGACRPANGHVLFKALATKLMMSCVVDASHRSQQRSYSSLAARRHVQLVDDADPGARAAVRTARRCCERTASSAARHSSQPGAAAGPCVSVAQTPAPHPTPHSPQSPPPPPPTPEAPQGSRPPPRRCPGPFMSFKFGAAAANSTGSTGSSASASSSPGASAGGFGAAAFGGGGGGGSPPQPAFGAPASSSGALGAGGGFGAPAAPAAPAAAQAGLSPPSQFPGGHRTRTTNPRAAPFAFAPSPTSSSPQPLFGSTGMAFSPQSAPAHGLAFNVGASAKGGFGGATAGGFGAFGAAASKPVGVGASATSGLGGAAAGGFGAAQAAGGFGAPATGGFGAAASSGVQSKPAFGGGFGAASSGGAFGGASNPGQASPAQFQPSVAPFQFSPPSSATASPVSFGNAASASHAARCAEIFRKFDTDGDGKLNKPEYKAYLQAIGAWECVADNEVKWWDQEWPKECERLSSAHSYAAGFRAPDGIRWESFLEVLYGKYRVGMVQLDLEACKQPRPAALLGWDKVVADQTLQPGQWICQVCLVRNERLSATGAPVAGCVACSMPKRSPGCSTTGAVQFDEHYQKPDPFGAEVVSRLREGVEVLEAARDSYHAAQSRLHEDNAKRQQIREASEALPSFALSSHEVLLEERDSAQEAFVAAGIVLRETM
eukprot:COSAG04_NODE_3418_length_2829_cov_1.878755_1_plen_666_part_10